METSHVAIYVLIAVFIGAGFVYLHAVAVARASVAMAAGLNIAVLAVHSVVFGFGLIPSVAISVFALCASIWLIKQRPTVELGESSSKGVSALAVMFSLLSGMYVSSIELSIVSLPFVAVSIIPALITKSHWHRYTIMCVVYACAFISYYSFLNEFASKGG